MPTTNVVNSTSMALYTSANGTTWVKIGRLTDSNHSVQHSTREITSKDSAGWAEFLEGKREASFSASGFYAMSDTNAADALHASLITRDATFIGFSTGVTGDKRYRASVYITSVEISSPDVEDNVTYSVEFQVTGAVTVETVA
jgi:hypothetical protein